MSKQINSIQHDVGEYYTCKVKSYGINPKGVDWNSTESQELRFKQLLKICEYDSNYSLIDYGCGYGALLAYMRNSDLYCTYQGYDLSEEMVRLCKERHLKTDNCDFYNDETLLTISDYTVASGILNVKLQYSISNWENYVLHTLKKINALSVKGFSLNLLTSYSDKEYMREDLYYGDPCFYFDYCKRNFSKNVALLHDYGLYEFTLLVRK